jgi:hypothetical protein
MPWLVFAGDSHPPGLPFCDGDEPIIRCKRETDARFLAEAEEGATETPELADPGFGRLDEPR